MDPTDRRPRRDLGPSPSTEPEPTFCPRCRAEGRPNHPLCPECGERVEPRGYCPTCEGFWKLSLGADCPKHDIPLDSAPPPPSFPGDPGRRAERWVTVADYVHPNEANAPRIRLEAEGVPTFLDGERVAVASFSHVATGGVRLQVPESLASAARVLLDQTWAAPVDPHDEDEDDPWAGLAPEPGGRRRAVMKGAILVMLFGPALIALASTVARILDWAR